MNDEDEPTTNDKSEQNKEETENCFSRASELRAMFEESLAMCFEPATVGVRTLLPFFLFFLMCFGEKFQFQNLFSKELFSPLLGVY